MIRMTKELRTFLATVLLACLCSANIASAKNEDTGLPPPNTFTDFRFGDDYSSFDPKDSVNAAHIEKGGGQVPNVIARYKDRVTLDCTPARTQIDVPLGWYALNQSNQSVIYSPDDTIKYKLHFVDIAPYQSWSEFKENAVKYVQEQMHQDFATFRQTNRKDGSVQITGTNIITKKGKNKSMIVVFTQDPKDSHQVMAITMTTPHSELFIHRQLLDLMIKHRKIDW